MSDLVLVEDSGTVSMAIENDFIVGYTHYNNRKDTKGAPKSVQLSKFLFMVMEPTRTQEYVEEFWSKSDAQKTDLKDRGGFIGGLVHKGRSAVNVANRSIIALDIDDHKDPDILGTIEKNLSKYCYTIYSTRKHTDTAPRYRLLVYLDTPIVSDMYQPIARMIASRMGMENFDSTTFAPERMMFYPTVSRDGTFYSYHNDKPCISGEAVLRAYEKQFNDPNAWRDPLFWPTCPRENADLKFKVSKASAPAADPRLKKNIVGAFCNTYTIPEAIDKFLSDCYTPYEGGRYSYVSPETQGVGGLVLYEDGVFCYSHHSTDPINTNHVYNAFDLVRVHLFGDSDTAAKEGQTGIKLPSYLAMTTFLRDHDVETMSTFSVMGVTNISEEFADALLDGVTPEQLLAETDEEKEDAKWLNELIRTDKHQIIPNMRHNVVTILKNDRHLKGIVRYNEFNDTMEHRSGVEWTDKWDTSVVMYMELTYNLAPSKDAFQSGIDYYAKSVANYHPIKDYLESLEWDGVERCETLFIDWLDAEDTRFVREAASLFTHAAIARTYRPGCKFDHMVVIDGKQGLGKSSFLNLLGKSVWHGELSTLDEKQAVESMTGSWIVEMAELKAKQGQSEDVKKAFITKDKFRFRAAYARRAETRPAWYVLAGTTNVDAYLTDPTGNRRYWPIHMSKQLDLKAFASTVDQIWAEALAKYNADPKRDLILSEEAALLAEKAQASKEDTHEWLGRIQDVLELPAPIDRYRKSFCPGFDGDTDRVELRTKVCLEEICEALSLDINRMSEGQKRTIKSCMKGLEHLGWQFAGKAISFGKYGKQRGWINVSNSTF